MIVGALLLQAAELATWFGLYRKVKSETTRQILTFGRPQPSRIPILDDQLRRLAGNPSKPAQMASKRVIGLARRLVNTRAFEHIVTGLINPKSKLRSKILKSKTIYCQF